MTMQPVVVAARDLSMRERLNSNDFHIVYRHSADIPNNAISDMSTVENLMYLLNPMAKGTILRTDNFVSYDPYELPVSISLPPGYKVINIKVTSQANSLAFYLLKPGDRIGLKAKIDGEEVPLDTPPLRVFNIGSSSIGMPRGSGGIGIVGLLVNEETADLISSNRKLGHELILSRPPETLVTNS